VTVRRPDGSLAAPGEPGELVHAGPLVAQGYWQDPERTSQRFRPEPDGTLAVWSAIRWWREPTDCSVSSGAMTR
jgi:acyl-CoA synthetase (AMP-forming)/AMP-acid ligase II